MIATSPGDLARGDQAVGVDPGQGLVVRLELGVRGHVGLAAVGIARDDAQLLALLHRQPPLPGLDADRHDPGVARLAEGRSRGDPVADRPVILRVADRADAPAVRHAPDILVNSRLCSGAAGKTRRPRDSLVKAAWSAAGSNPKTDSLNPFCPSALPWQPEALQPSLLSTGTMSFSKLNGRACAEPSTRTPTVRDSPPASTTTVVRPSPTGRTTPRASTVATAGSSVRNRAERVRSTVAPSSLFPVTRIKRRADGPGQPHLGRVGRHSRDRLFPRGVTGKHQEQRRQYGQGRAPSTVSK